MTNETIARRALTSHVWHLEAQLAKHSTGRDLKFNALMTKCGAPAHAFRKITPCAQYNYHRTMTELFLTKAMVEEAYQFDDTGYHAKLAREHREDAARHEALKEAISEAAEVQEDDRVAQAEACDYQKVEDCYR